MELRDIWEVDIVGPGQALVTQGKVGSCPFLKKPWTFWFIVRFRHSF